jgi:hypothetical protein
VVLLAAHAPVRADDDGLGGVAVMDTSFMGDASRWVLPRALAGVQAPTGAVSFILCSTADVGSRAGKRVGCSPQRVRKTSETAPRLPPEHGPNQQVRGTQPPAANGDQRSGPTRRRRRPDMAMPAGSPTGGHRSTT